MSHLRFNSAVVLILLATVSAPAEQVFVEATGTVEFSVIAGSMAGVRPGDPVQMSFLVDSNRFLSSPTFPTRGYAVDLNSFSMTVGGRPVPIVIPQPAGGTAYFVLRNNDPMVDGFLLSTNVDFPFPVAVEIPGLAPIHEMDFLVTYTSGSVLSSLDILDALGTYTTSGISSYDWTIGRFGADGAAYTFQSLTLTGVPEPAALTMLVIGGGGLLLLALRRKTFVRVSTPGYGKE